MERIRATLKLLGGSCDWVVWLEGDTWITNDSQLVGKKLTALLQTRRTSMRLAATLSLQLGRLWPLAADVLLMATWQASTHPSQFVVEAEAQQASASRPPPQFIFSNDIVGDDSLNTGVGLVRRSATAVRVLQRVLSTLRTHATHQLVRTCDSV